MTSVHEEPNKGNVSPPLNYGGIPVESEASLIQKTAQNLWERLDVPVTEPTNSPPPVGPVVRPDDNRLRKRKRKSEGVNNRPPPVGPVVRPDDNRLRKRKSEGDNNRPPPKVRRIVSILDSEKENRIIGFLVPMNEKLTIVSPKQLMKNRPPPPSMKRWPRDYK